MNYKKLIPTVLYLAVLFLVLSWASGLMSSTVSSVPYSQVVDLLEQEQVKSFVIRDNSITLELNTPVGGKTELKANLADRDLFFRENGDLIREQTEKGVLLSYDVAPDKGFSA